MYPQTSFTATTGGTAQAVAISSTSAASAAITTATWAVVYATVDCFFRKGTTPVALSNGTDQFLPGGTPYRIDGITSGDKLAFITTGATGSVYITPGA